MFSPPQYGCKLEDEESTLFSDGDQVSEIGMETRPSSPAIEPPRTTELERPISVIYTLMPQWPSKEGAQNVIGVLGRTKTVGIWLSISALNERLLMMAMGTADCRKQRKSFGEGFPSWLLTLLDV